MPVQAPTRKNRNRFITEDAMPTAAKLSSLVKLLMTTLSIVL